jgi:tetratricopeptide (TPR) repeat protein
MALDYIKKADDLKPDHSDTLYIKGRCFMDIYDYKKSLELLVQATNQNKSEASYWASLALIYFKNGDYCESFENLIKATSINPS